MQSYHCFNIHWKGRLALLFERLIDDFSEGFLVSFLQPSIRDCKDGGPVSSSAHSRMLLAMQSAPFLLVNANQTEASGHHSIKQAELRHGNENEMNDNNNSSNDDDCK